MFLFASQNYLIANNKDTWQTQQELVWDSREQPTHWMMTYDNKHSSLSTLNHSVLIHIKISLHYSQLAQQIRSLIWPFRFIINTRSDVIVPRCRTKFGSRAFSIAGPEVWNHLPQSVRSADIVSQFRRLLKTHYFLLHYCPTKQCCYSF